MIAIPRLNLFETIRIYEHDLDFEPIDAKTPTGADPGSLAKIRVMQERLKRGEHLHHNGDCKRSARIEVSDEMAAIIQVAAKDARDVARARREASGVIDKRARRSFIRKRIEVNG